jgi:hypothetical protein
MAPYTPRIPLLLDKRRAAVKRVAALRAEEVTNVPLRTARDDDLSLDGCLAALAARREQLVEVEVAVEAQGLVMPVFSLELLHRFVGRMRVQHGKVVAALACVDARYALGVLGGRLRVEGHAFEVLAAVVALEALRVEADTCC